MDSTDKTLVLTAIQCGRHWTEAIPHYRRLPTEDRDEFLWKFLLFSCCSNAFGENIVYSCSYTRKNGRFSRPYRLAVHVDNGHKWRIGTPVAPQKQISHSSRGFRDLVGHMRLSLFNYSKRRNYMLFAWRLIIRW